MLETFKNTLRAINRFTANKNKKMENICRCKRAWDLMVTWFPRSETTSRSIHAGYTVGERTDNFTQQFAFQVFAYMEICQRT